MVPRPWESGALTAIRSSSLAPLPAPPNILLGRERDVAQASAYLRQPGLRVLTLTGPGGVGKTRLALEVARSLRPDFADGVWFISLAPVDDADLAVAMIAQTLGLVEHGDEPLGRLRRYLREREMLLVLDNLEQILPIAASLASLLASCPDLKLLVPSREPMRISGEQQ